MLFDDCALHGRLAVEITQEIRSCGTPRGQSGDHPTRQYARGNAAPLGPLTRRYAMACAHHRDNIPASGNISSPSAGAGRGAAPLTVLRGGAGGLLVAREGQARSVAKAVCFSCTSWRLSWGRTPSRSWAQPLARYLYSQHA